MTVAGLQEFLLRITSQGTKFRHICRLACCGGRGVQESAFSLAWLAEELIPWNKPINL